MTSQSYPQRSKCYPSRSLPGCSECDRFRPGNGYRPQRKTVIIDASALADGDRCPILMADKAAQHARVDVAHGKARVVITGGELNGEARQALWGAL